MTLKSEKKGGRNKFMHLTFSGHSSKFKHGYILQVCWELDPERCSARYCWDAESYVIAPNIADTPETQMKKM